MIKKNITLKAFVICLAVLLSACGDKFETVSGYTPKKLSKEGLDKQLEETIKNMVFVKGGSFMMGCLNGKGSLAPEVLKYIGSKRATDQHFFFDSPPVIPCKPDNKVTLDSFNIGKFEISFAEYDLFTQEAGLPFLRNMALHATVQRKKDRDYREGGKSANAGWHQANRYCEWLADQTGLAFSLPTEAQWEYTARSRGLNVPYATDTGYWNIGVNFPTYEEADAITAQSTKYPPNPLGIYHMTDTMSEWVQDWYGKNYYDNAPEHNPKGPDSGIKKVLRGGDKSGSPQHSTVWSRGYETPLWDKEWTELRVKAKEKGRDVELNNENPVSRSNGFRCALNQPKPVSIKDINQGVGLN